MTNENSMAFQYMQMAKMQMGFQERQNTVRNEKGDITVTPANIPAQHVPMPQEQAGRHMHGVSSQVLPDMHHSGMGSSPIRFNGSTLHHGERRGCAIELSHGSVVNVRHLEGFGVGHGLPGSLPDFKAPVLKKR